MGLGVDAIRTGGARSSPLVGPSIRTQQPRPLYRRSLCIARGKACHLRDEGRELEHGNPDKPLGNGAELATETGDG
jgi:hypothetical protein